MPKKSNYLYFYFTMCSVVIQTHNLFCFWFWLITDVSTWCILLMHKWVTFADIPVSIFIMVIVIKFDIFANSIMLLLVNLFNLKIFSLYFCFIFINAGLVIEIWQENVFVKNYQHFCFPSLSVRPCLATTSLKFIDKIANVILSKTNILDFFLL